MRWMGLPTTIRVTVGTHEENDKFLAALESARKAESPAPNDAEPARFLEENSRSPVEITEIFVGCSFSYGISATKPERL